MIEESSQHVDNVVLVLTQALSCKVPVEQSSAQEPETEAF